MVAVSSPQLPDEDCIEWERPPETVDGYLREGVVMSRSPTKPVDLGAVDGEVAAYAVLAHDATPARQRFRRQYARRVWYVRGDDPYVPGPAEAVDAATVTAGVGSSPWLASGGGEA